MDGSQHAAAEEHKDGKRLPSTLKKLVNDAKIITEHLKDEPSSNLHNKNDVSHESATHNNVDNVKCKRSKLSSSHESSRNQEDCAQIKKLIQFKHKQHKHDLLSTKSGRKKAVNHNMLTIQKDNKNKFLKYLKSKQSLVDQIKNTSRNKTFINAVIVGDSNDERQFPLNGSIQNGNQTADQLITKTFDQTNDGVFVAFIDSQNLTLNPKLPTRNISDNIDSRFSKPEYIIKTDLSADTKSLNETQVFPESNSKISPSSMSDTAPNRDEENELQKQMNTLRKALSDYHKASQLKTAALKELSKTPLVLISPTADILKETKSILDQRNELLSSASSNSIESTTQHKGLKDLETLIRFAENNAAFGINEGGARTSLLTTKKNASQNNNTTKEEYIFEKANRNP